MASSSPSDIVLDVARAVEPKGVEAVSAEFAKRAGSASAAAAGVFSLAATGDARTNAADGVKPETPESFKRFEAMVLQTFIQNMLPMDGAAVYGKGVAGDMWKSLLSEKIADVMAERGGIGISDRILGGHYVEGKKALSVASVSGVPEASETDRQTMLSTALVEEIQRKLAKSLAEDQASTASQPEI